MDRLVLTADNIPSVKAVVLAPPFVGAGYFFYVFGPPAPELTIFESSGRKIMGSQRVVGTVPNWSQILTSLQFPMPFYRRLDGAYIPEEPEFSALPPTSPLSIGSGWFVMQSEPGKECAVRRSPIIVPTPDVFEHPYSYAYAVRRAERFFLKPVAVVKDEGLREIGFPAFASRLHEAELQHPEGFVIASN